VTVNTVDHFLGEERDIVIVSCGRAREKPGNLGLLGSHHLTRTALSRAKESLIVCGHSQTLKTSEHWNSLYEHAKAAQASHIVMSTFTEIMLRNILLRT